MDDVVSDERLKTLLQIGCCIGSHAEDVLILSELKRLRTRAPVDAAARKVAEAAMVVMDTPACEDHPGSRARISLWVAACAYRAALSAEQANKNQQAGAEAVTSRGMPAHASAAVDSAPAPSASAAGPERLTPEERAERVAPTWADIARDKGISKVRGSFRNPSGGTFSDPYSSALRAHIAREIRVAEQCVRAECEAWAKRCTAFADSHARSAEAATRRADATEAEVARLARELEQAQADTKQAWAQFDAERAKRCELEARAPDALRRAEQQRDNARTEAKALRERLREARTCMSRVGYGERLAAKPDPLREAAAEACMAHTRVCMASSMPWQPSPQGLAGYAAEQALRALDAGQTAAPRVWVVVDPVNHPSHYTRGGIEAIDVIEAWGLDFCAGNALKYLARAGHKGDAVEDLRKARWYIDRALSAREAAGGVA